MQAFSSLKVGSNYKLLPKDYSSSFSRLLISSISRLASNCSISSCSFKRISVLTHQTKKSFGRNKHILPLGYIIKSRIYLIWKYILTADFDVKHFNSLIFAPL
jgi:hypothetical protein